MLKVQEIREIIRLIDQSSINEFTYETNEATIIMKKTAVGNVAMESSQVPAETSKQEQVVATPQKDVTEEKIEKKVEDPPRFNEEGSVDYDYEIVSPMVGTFYHASSPENDPYVKVGSKVEDETVVCIVEAMKLFNEIEAESTGEIVEILVNDGALVEYGQPLFRVKTK